MPDPGVFDDGNDDDAGPVRERRAVQINSCIAGHLTFGFPSQSRRQAAEKLWAELDDETRQGLIDFYGC